MILKWKWKWYWNEKDSDMIYKTPPEEVDYEYYTIENPVKRINGKLYVTAEGSFSIL